MRGCSKISPGCAHCYAETFAERFRGVPGHPYEQGFDLRLVPEKLLEPLRWQQPRMIFVNSMSDLFHEEVPDEYIKRVAIVMQRANWHTYQILTKRSARLSKLLRTTLREAAQASHIWWGVSVENRRVGLPRLQDLRLSNACMRFLSIEPLLEDLGALDLKGMSWVIVGGESGVGRTFDGARLGCLRTETVSDSESSVFLQAVGRYPKDRSWAKPFRPHVRRVPTSYSSNSTETATTEATTAGYGDRPVH